MVEHIAASGGDAAILDRIANGETMSSIAAEFGASRAMLSKHLSSSPERKRDLEAAKKEAAHALADQSGDILDGATPYSIAVDRERAKNRQWRASVLNREEYGESKAAVTINLGGLHLAAFQLRPAESEPRFTAVEQANLPRDHTEVCHFDTPTLPGSSESSDSTLLPVLSPGSTDYETVSQPST